MADTTTESAAVGGAPESGSDAPGTETAPPAKPEAAAPPSPEQAAEPPATKPPEPPAPEEAKPEDASPFK